MTSITNTLVKETPPTELIATLDPEPNYYLRLISLTFGAILVVILILDRSGKLLQWHLDRRRRKDRKDKKENNENQENEDTRQS